MRSHCIPFLASFIFSLLLLSACSSTDNKRIIEAIATGGSIEHEVKKVIKQKEQVYKQNPEQIIADVKSIKALLAQLSKDVQGVWGSKDIKLPTNKRYVKYTNDYKARAIVDFDKGLLTVETVDKKAPKAMLQKAIVTTLLTTENPKETDIFSSKTPTTGGTPFLYHQIEDQDNKAIRYQWRANRFADYLVANKLSQKQTRRHSIHFVQVPLVPQHQHLRKQKYSQYVLASAKRYQIQPSLIYGVIETESSFNPYAVSHANAYGLMQVVASTAGRDVYEKVKNKSGQPTKQVLFNPQQNIDIGTAYLSILHTRYLAKINNLTSRHYSVISAYNGGAGNVLKTFANNRDTAVTRINKLNSQQVYNKLTKEHPKDESRRYLYKVHKAEQKYRTN